MQAVTALAHLKAAILYVMDISEQCDKTLAEQIHLFESIRPLFANKPVIVALNKTDIVTRAELSPEKQQMLTDLEKDGIPLLEMSTVSKTGVVEIRDRACDDLLAQRVETKLQAKKTTISDGGVLSRVFVAYPEKRDEVVRAPFIPDAVLHKRVKGASGAPADKIARGLGNMGKAPTKFNRMEEDDSVAEMRDENTRRLERELELELDDDYILDLKKNYLLKNEDEKYDVIPEIWNGHNIADFVDEQVQAKMAALMQEEENLIAAGEYDQDLESEDEELAENARLIAEKEEELRFMAREKKTLNGKRTSRSVTRKRDRTMGKLEEQLGELGVDINAKRMKHLQEMAGKEHTVKKIRVGKSRSLTANRAESRDKLGIRDERTRSKSRVMAKRAQKPANQESRKGEGDRRFMDLKPKHLFSGKRGNGKTDRR
ncbi:hypothetical protein PMAYCL1PPCAC_33354 [Pristionchus mayeri]|uniref:Nucleolar GTP-binding protein 1 n=2 Tax=Pristionchus mayeri TaxID=1317129 RepID=A0AAN5DIV2_9BILA|nr:hypothetical protein PMAYCL1PPCAC_33354 [Pristionchus mayeri]